MTIDKEKLRREDEEFALRAGRSLRNSADELDAATLSRLNRARQAALDAIDDPSPSLRNRNRWLQVGAAASAAIVVAVWLGQALSPDAGPLPVARGGAGQDVVDEAADLALLLDDGDPEMYAELEFFVWLPEAELETIG